MASHPYPNPDLEIALNLVLQGRIISQETRERVEIAYTPSITGEICSNTIRGAMIASSRNANVSLVISDRATTESLFALIQPYGCSRRVSTSSQTKDWLRPLLLQLYQLGVEHNPLVMLYTQVAWEGEGRWASPRINHLISLCQAPTGLSAVVAAWLKIGMP